MKKVEIQLNENYRSFDAGFTISLSGKIIILSGVNGSGKSQLINIISQRDSRNRNNILNSSILLDGRKINHNEVLKRSFIDNTTIQELTRAGSDRVKHHHNQAWEAYHRYRLDYTQSNLWDFTVSCKKAKNLLIKEFGNTKFVNGQIDQEEFLEFMPTDFVWKPDDIFSHFVGESFYNHALAIYQAKAESYDTRVKIDELLIKSAPWIKLNKLFEELGLQYRFKDTYKIDKLALNEQPVIYAINSQGNIIESEKRRLSDLSDGEKAIISLVFASSSQVNNENIKILLLDEFDANFNPSLTESFYEVLKKYFIDKGVLVIMATHSPTTISLAPEGTRFYEVFKKDLLADNNRILPVFRDNYSELEVANKRFFAKISNQKQRIIELEDTVTNIQELSKESKTSIFFEGNLDLQYIKKAAELCPAWAVIIEDVELKERNGSSGVKKIWENKEFLSELTDVKLILIFDCDTKQVSDNYERIYKFSIPLNEKNSIKKGIENLFEDSLITKAEKKHKKEFARRSIPDKKYPKREYWRLKKEHKRELANWICENATKEDFKHFESIFEELKKIISL